MLENDKLSTPCSIVSLCCTSQWHLPAHCCAACTSTFPGGTFLLLWLVSEVPDFTFLSFFKQRPEEGSGLSGLFHAQLPLTLFSFSFSPVSFKENPCENSSSQQLPQDRGLPPRHSGRAIRELQTFRHGTQLLTCLSTKAAAIKPVQTGKGLSVTPSSRMQL